jgi:uncharacterized membrane protein HdeD (DUF308 family)
LVDIFVVYIVGFLAIIQGVVGLIHAFRAGGWGAGILGILSIIFGLVLVLNPLLGMVVMPLILGAFMLAGGIAAIVVSLYMRGSSPTAAAA